MIITVGPYCVRRITVDLLDNADLHLAARGSRPEGREANCLRRLLDVKFPGTDATAHLEILGRRKDDAIADLFGPVRDVSERTSAP